MPRRSPSKPPRESPERQRIVDLARQRFFALGIRSVTMDEIADALGMSKKTLYAHFSSKAELAQAVALDKFGEVDADLKSITSARSADVVSALHQLITVLQRHLDELKPPYWRDIERDAPDLFHLMENRRQELIQQHFGKLLAQGRRAGVVRKDVSTTLIIELLLAAVHSIVNPTKLQQLGIGPREGISAILAVVFEGVITECERS